MTYARPQKSYAKDYGRPRGRGGRGVGGGKKGKDKVKGDRDGGYIPRYDRVKDQMLHDTFSRRMTKLIANEREVELESSMNRIMKTPVDKLVREGLACLNIKVVSKGLFYGLKLFNITSHGWPYNSQIKSRDIVIFTRAGKQPSMAAKDLVLGTVVDCLPMRNSYGGGIAVVGTGLEAYQGGRIDIGFNEYIYQVLNGAVAACFEGFNENPVVKDNGTSELPGSPLFQRIKDSYTEQLNKLNGSEDEVLKNLNLHNATLNEIPDSDLLNLDGIDYKSLFNVNPYQANAISRIIRDVSSKDSSLHVIHGPPGCGKTSTIVELVGILHKMLPSVPILVSGHTNIAVDVVLDKIKRQLSIPALRIGLR